MCDKLPIISTTDIESLYDYMHSFANSPSGIYERSFVCGIPPLKILAIETTERQGSIALYESASLQHHHTLPANDRSAATLAPEIKAVCARHNWTLSDIDRIAVTTGPGSFTGLRVGIVTAKTLGYALGRDVVGINTLDAIALQANHVGELEVVMDAQRNEVFSRRYLLESESFPKPLNDITIIDDQLWVAQLPDGIKVTGPVLKKLNDRLGARIETELESNWAPRADSVARLAAVTQPIDSPFKLMPEYFRKSAAEEKHQQAQNET